MIFNKIFERKFCIHDGKFEINDVPFFSQRLDKNNYQEEGFESLKEARYWSERVCALACLKMILKKFHPTSDVSFGKLLKKGREIGAYREDVGWLHQGITELAEMYGLLAKRESIGFNLEKMGKYITRGEPVIASVTVGFEAGKKYPEEDGSVYVMPKGGHLVVVFGVEVKDGAVQKLKLHHPSSEADYEWPNHEIDRKNFLHSFSEAGNIIIFGRPV